MEIQVQQSSEKMVVHAIDDVTKDTVVCGDIWKIARMSEFFYRVEEDDEMTVCQKCKKALEERYENERLARESSK